MSNREREIVRYLNDDRFPSEIAQRSDVRGDRVEQGERKWNDQTTRTIGFDLNDERTSLRSSSSPVTDHVQLNRSETEIVNHHGMVAEMSIDGSHR